MLKNVILAFSENLSMTSGIKVLTKTLTSTKLTLYKATNLDSLKQRKRS